MASNPANNYTAQSVSASRLGNLVPASMTQNLVLERECRFDPDRRYFSLDQANWPSTFCGTAALSDGYRF